MRKFLYLCVLILAGCQFSIPNQAPDCKPDVNCEQVVGSELRVLILEDVGSRSKLPPKQLQVLTAKSVRDYLKAHCFRDPLTGTPEFRIFDSKTNLSGSWKEMVDKNKFKSLPWVYVTNGSSGISAPLPDIDNFIQFISPYSPR